MHFLFKLTDYTLKLIKPCFHKQIFQNCSVVWIMQLSITKVVSKCILITKRTSTDQTNELTLNVTCNKFNKMIRIRSPSLGSLFRIPLSHFVVWLKLLTNQKPPDYAHTSVFRITLPQEIYGDQSEASISLTDAHIWYSGSLCRLLCPRMPTFTLLTDSHTRPMSRHFLQSGLFLDNLFREKRQFRYKDTASSSPFFCFKVSLLLRETLEQKKGRGNVSYERMGLLRESHICGKFNLGINRSVKTPWQQYWAVVRF